MLRKFLGSVICLLILSSVKSYAQPAVDLNDSLATILDSALYYKAQWFKNFKTIDAGPKNYEDMKEYRTAWGGFIDQQLPIIKNMHEVGGSAKYRGALFMYLKFEKQFVDNVATPVEKMTTKSTIVEMKPFHDRMYDVAIKEKEYLKKVKAEQQNYAKANNFSVSETAGND